MEREQAIGGRKVRDVRHLLVTDPGTVRADDPVEHLLEKILEDPRTRHVYVVDEDLRLIGSVRMLRVIQCLFPMTATLARSDELMGSRSPFAEANTVGDLMDRNPCWVAEDTSLSEVARILLREQISELPVIDSAKRVIGQVNMYEIIADFLRKRKDGS